MEKRFKHIRAFVIIGLIVIGGGLVLNYTEQQKSLKKQGYQLITRQSDSGDWYYEIYFGESLKIRQRTIPGISGNQPFASEKQARGIGNLVLEKLQEGQAPIITSEDLKKYGFAHQK
ncbi:DUF4907 domain-containing protein [Poritiphilus flavus]|uniref:DUF4907 domain-containing protein n=1 Tax=Poritiphilus flavus TaxID=2697053 RepID=A0A6L9EBG2_9FLAO|nr:DUF4907 domain-containing protein [Poritiphilus flavus]NAS11942.1 DUF4907 domain-containing protein [Poritiphilus flavus]